jgi:peptide/nickel transport system substrate-binding protein
VVVHDSLALTYRAALAWSLALALIAALPAPGASSSSALTIARVKDAVGLDPAHETDGLSLNVSSEVLQGLVAFKPGTFEIVPSIASSWRSSRGTRWTFTLRHGLRFSDGTPVDAAAVKFNFDRWRLTGDPYHGASIYPYYEDVFGGFPGKLKDVHVDSPTQVTFVLTQPMATFLAVLAMPSFAIGSPKAIAANPRAYAEKPVGSGPYEVAEWVKDDHITLVANPAYAGPRPVYTRVTLRDIPDQATSVLALQTGEVDGLTDPRPDDARRLAANKKLRVYLEPSNNVAYLALNVDRKPFDRVDVRRAVAYALDLPAIVRGLYGPGAAVANDFLPPGMLGDDPSLRAYPHDPARARALLAQAGFPHGFSTSLFYGTAPRPYLADPQRVAEAIAAQLHDAGITMTLQPFEWGVFLAKIRNGEHPMCLIGWIGDNGDPDNFLYTLLDRDAATKGSAQNYSFWRDATFHRLMLEGQTALDRGSRAAIYRRALRLVHDDVPVIPLVHTSAPFVMKASIANVIPRPDSILNFELMRPQ